MNGRDLDDPKSEPSGPWNGFAAPDTSNPSHTPTDYHSIASWQSNNAPDIAAEDKTNHQEKEEENKPVPIKCITQLFALIIISVASILVWNFVGRGFPWFIYIIGTFCTVWEVQYFFAKICAYPSSKNFRIIKKKKRDFFYMHLTLFLTINSVIIFTWFFWRAEEWRGFPWFIYPLGISAILLGLHFYITYYGWDKVWLVPQIFIFLIVNIVNVCTWYFNMYQYNGDKYPWFLWVLGIWGGLIIVQLTIYTVVTCIQQQQKKLSVLRQKAAYRFPNYSTNKGGRIKTRDKDSHMYNERKASSHGLVAPEYPQLTSHLDPALPPKAMIHHNQFTQLSHQHLNESNPVNTNKPVETGIPDTDYDVKTIGSPIYSNFPTLPAQKNGELLCFPIDYKSPQETVYTIYTPGNGEDCSLPVAHTNGHYIGRSERAVSLSASPITST